jgi:hypothetical protein
MKRLLAGLLLLAPMVHAQPVRITGRIVQPPANTAVELQSFTDTRAESLQRLAGEPIAPLASAKPRADGSFELKAPEPGFYSVVVRAEGRLARKSFLTFVVEDVELPPVELPATAPLRVRAVGPDGLPLAGVTIQALPVKPREDGWGADDRRAVTDADGRATFLRAEGEELRLTITTPGRYGVALTGPSGSEQAVAFRKPGARVVEIRNPDGKPAADALVRIGNRGWPYGLTGEDGRIALPVPGDGEIVALAEDAMGHRIEIVMTVEAGEGTGVPVISLRSPTLVTGQVLDAATREPLAGALVWNGGPGAKGWVRSDPRGGFELRAPSGDRGRLEAQAPGRVRHRRRWIRDDNQPVTFALEAAGSIAGLVVDEAGRPLAGARVRPGRGRPRTAGARRLRLAPGTASGEHLLGAPGRQLRGRLFSDPGRSRRRLPADRPAARLRTLGSSRDGPGRRRSGPGTGAPALSGSRDPGEAPRSDTRRPRPGRSSRLGGILDGSLSGPGGRRRLLQNSGPLAGEMDCPGPRSLARDRGPGDGRDRRR